MSAGGEVTSLRGLLKETIRELNTEHTRMGVDVDAVVEAAADRGEYTEADTRAALNDMLLEGEVFPPTEGRVRVTP